MPSDFTRGGLAASGPLETQDGRTPNSKVLTLVHHPWSLSLLHEPGSKIDAARRLACLGQVFRYLLSRRQVAKGGRSPPPHLSLWVCLTLPACMPSKCARVLEGRTPAALKKRLGWSFAGSRMHIAGVRSRLFNLATLPAHLSNQDLLLRGLPRTRF